MNIAIAEAKARLSELVSRAEAGEEIVITRRGKVAARLVPLAVPESLPRVGAMKVKIRIADDFDELGPEWDGYAK
ncbi:type II toxin-antitoxin system prevent-host-death family antitoxin [Mesorhizobium sp. M0019]|uniref:type II toxin-antitoxin system Phd/YefM family antitoxin n=1 Tax=Mesorhizobium sp. M0019 TaxID=2956845 RepID=UPI003339CEE1